MAKKVAPQELGFGKYITTTGRMMEADGSTNVHRRGAHPTADVYFNLITMHWSRFLLLVFCIYLGINTLFTFGYMAIGVEQLTGMVVGSAKEAWYDAFFFSTQTLTTVGYGRVSPLGFGANALASIESFIGLLGFALVSGLLYGRFSRPEAMIAFSKNLLIAPFQDGRGLMFRMANMRRSELINTEVQMLISFNEIDASGQISRAFRPLILQLNTVIFFSMSWTLVHKIDEESPIYGLTEEQLRDSNLEIFVLVKATEEANQQTVTARRSYVYADFVWNAKFKPMMSKDSSGISVVLLDNLNDYELL